MKKYAEDYTLTELMVVTTAREFRNGEVAFIGTGIPMVAGMLAKLTHAPDLTIIFEAGAADPELEHLPMSVGEPRTFRMAGIAAGLFDIFSLTQRGRVDVGVIGGAQVDKFGNVNSTCIGDYGNPAVRFPGSGGAGDIACLCKRTVILMPHEKRRFVEKVDYLTSPGWIDGPDGRNRAGLQWGGPSAVITTMGVIRFEEKTKKPYLESYHPGLTPEEVLENTGFEIDVSKAIETEPPTEEEIWILREKVDPEGIFLKK
ncbi:CoA-transferase [Geoglobus acetivorans]|uniref:Acyl CoA--acetate/3-ketoacid CoA transferase subunit beta n=1 Tax=Geoglobus acetivorans TaxID=565033 RepID=A0ABZ3H4W1_GEOAI|nr:ketoacid-CoA transferase [Geoglobus acetivorans]